MAIYFLLQLEAIKQTKVNMTVFLGNYPIATDNGTAYERQRNELKAAIQTYGTDHISGVTVGNEFMLKLVFFSFMPFQARINVLRFFFSTYSYVTDAGIQDPNSAVADVGAQILIGDIKDTQSMLSGMSLGSLPVGNSDAGSYFNNEVLADVDYGVRCFLSFTLLATFLSYIFMCVDTDG